MFLSPCPRYTHYGKSISACDVHVAYNCVLLHFWSIHWLIGHFTKMVPHTMCSQLACYKIFIQILFYINTILGYWVSIIPQTAVIDISEAFLIQFNIDIKMAKICMSQIMLTTPAPICTHYGQSRSVFDIHLDCSTVSLHFWSIVWLIWQNIVSHSIRFHLGCCQ